MKWRRDMKIAWRKKMGPIRSWMCWTNNSGRTWSSTENPMSSSRNKNNSGWNKHSQMKLLQYKLRIHPSSWNRANMVSSIVDRMKRIQHHACFWAHAYNPTHSTHSPRQRQEASPTMDERAHLKISTDTLHQCVSSSTVPKKTMRMLADDLDEGAEPMHRLRHEGKS